MPPLIEFDPSAWAVGLSAAGLFSLLFSGVSRISKERLFLSEPSVAVGAGALVEFALSLNERLGDMLLLGEGAAPDVVREVSRTVIGIQVFTTAIELPKAYFTNQRNLQSVLVALFPIMMMTWIIVFLLTFGIMGFSPLPSLAVAACLTPTDPIIIHTVVKGAFAEYILPSRFRHFVSAESGLNDGTALPFVMLPLVLLEAASSHWKAAKFLGVVIAWETLGGIAFGIAFGWLSGKLLAWSLRHACMEHDSLLAYTYVLSIGTLGVAQMLELNGILACFFSGIFFSAGLNAKERTEELQLQETADLLAGNLFFLMLGAVLPWGVWFRELSWWRLLVLAVSVNLLKRLPLVLASYRVLPSIMSFCEALHAGWFGPTGAASFLYALELLRRIRDPIAARQAYLVVTWMVMISVFLHSTTGVPLTKWLARGMTRDPSDPEEKDDVFKNWDVQDWREAIEPEPSEPSQARKDSSSQAPEAPLPPPGKLFVRVPSVPAPLQRLSQQQQQTGQRPATPVEEIQGAVQDGPLSQALGIESKRSEKEKIKRFPWLQRLCKVLMAWLATSRKLFHREPSSWVTKRERRRWRRGQSSSCI